MPAVAEWLADRIDDLAGMPYTAAGEPRPALTFGQLWRGTIHGPNVDCAPLSEQARKRVINLELMTTNISQGRPYRLPFQARAQADPIGGTRWLFCTTCLKDVLAERVVDQLGKAPGADPAHLSCPRHEDVDLRCLPEPWDMPVAMAARMSLSLPGLIAAVPLCSPPSADSSRDGPLPQWFSDGGITSNFPIHLFDALLPRWPTFGLNLQEFPPGPGKKVFIPPQNSTTSTEAWAPVYSTFRFLGSILDTFLGWRDTMQSALPGFRGRIAHVRQGRDEGGTNLFMRCETIEELAHRGQRAGTKLLNRFTGVDIPTPVSSSGRSWTQTDRYRWIRMRMAMCKYSDIAHEINDGAALYTDLAQYRVPVALGGWFKPGLTAPTVDPKGADVANAVTALAKLARQGQPLADRIAGAPPVEPNLRFTPKE
jgi:hypothetical protein